MGEKKHTGGFGFTNFKSYPDELGTTTSQHGMDQQYTKNDFLSRTATNLIDANVLSARDYKQNVFEFYKQNIMKLHNKHMGIKTVSRAQGISQLQKLLP